MQTIQEQVRKQADRQKGKSRYRAAGHRDTEMSTPKGQEANVVGYLMKGKE
jgi:hypothetical protein